MNTQKRFPFNVDTSDESVGKAIAAQLDAFSALSLQAKMALVEHWNGTVAQANTQYAHLGEWEWSMGWRGPQITLRFPKRR